MARACSCSFCRPRRATHISHSGARLSATDEDGHFLSRYRFGTSTADFFVCAQCGGVPFAVSKIDRHDHAVVNVFTMDDAENTVFDISASDFDGEDPEARLARRKRIRIPQVEIKINIFLDPAGMPIAILVLVLEVFLAWAYRDAFRGVLSLRAKPAA